MSLEPLGRFILKEVLARRCVIFMLRVMTYVVSYKLLWNSIVVVQFVSHEGSYKDKPNKDTKIECHRQDLFLTDKIFFVEKMRHRQDVFVEKKQCILF